MDNHTPEQRKRNMQAVHNKDTKIEMALRKELWARGMRYRKNAKTVYGHPDIAFIGKKVAVFCDSEFWHGYDWENRKPKLKRNREYWIEKIEENIARDSRVDKELIALGWTPIRFWAKEVHKDLDGCIKTIKEMIFEHQIETID